MGWLMDPTWETRSLFLINHISSHTWHPSPGDGDRGHARHTSSGACARIHPPAHAYRLTCTHQKGKQPFKISATCAPARKPGVWFPGSHTAPRASQMLTLGSGVSLGFTEGSEGWTELPGPRLTPPWIFLWPQRHSSDPLPPFCSGQG